MEKFKHKKSLGQNFLNNEKVLLDIAGAIDTKEEDLIIEVGPGQGALTKHLINKKGLLYCYEIDERVKPYLSKFESSKTKIIFKDFLNSNFEDDINNLNYDRLYFIANIPYYITTPIIEKIVTSKVQVDAIVLMVQKEVALRLAAKPGSKAYGSLTVFLNYYYDIDYLFDVGRNNFDPVPNVDSAVVKFVKKQNSEEVKNEDVFFKLIYDAFKLKRKNLKNNLCTYNLEIIERLLNEEGLSLQSRAEQVPVSVFIKIANELSKG